MSRASRCLVALVVAAGCSKREPAPTPAPVAAVVVPDAAPPAPDVVTQASPPPPEDPKGTPEPSTPVLTDATVDGAALRARQRKRLAADHAPVTVLQGGDALALGQRICEAVVPTELAGKPVLLKPNMTGINWFKNPKTSHGDNGVSGRTTDPEFVRGVVRCLKAKGFARITIADSFAGKPTDWDRLVKVSGYAAMASEEQVPLVAMDDDGIYDVQGDQPGKPLGISGMAKTSVPTLLMPKLLADHLDHGLVISLPKIKDHRFAGFSLALKGMQGTAMYSDAAPAYHQKWRTHREIGHALELVKAKDPTARAVYVKSLETFATRIVDIFELEAPDLVLAEGAPMMDGDGFEQLLPRPVNVAIGGSNPILVDRIGAELLGLWDSAALARELGGHRTSPLLEVAAKRFGLDLRAPAVVGDGAALLREHQPAHYIAMAGFTIDERAHADAPRQLHAAHVADDRLPALDGAAIIPSDSVWQTAPALAFATDWSGAETTTDTEVRALWNASGLYLRWELADTGLNVDRTRPTDVERVDLYEEDCVEAFVGADPATPQRYFEIELGPFGHFFDLAIDLAAKTVAGRGDQAWSAGLRLGTSQDPERHRAVIEVAITAPEIVGALRAGAELPLGLYRMEGAKPRQYLAAFPTRTPKPSFHVPSAFGRLVLDP